MDTSRSWLPHSTAALADPAALADVTSSGAVPSDQSMVLEILSSPGGRRNINFLVGAVELDDCVVTVQW